VFHHPRIAMVAPHLSPAGTADRHRRIAASVEKQERLFPRLHPGHLRGQCRRQPRLRGQVLQPHVDRRHLGQHRLPEPRCQIEPPVLPRLRVGPCLQRRRGRGQHHLRVVQRRPQHRHVPRVVKRAFLLFVGTVVFLIHDDQAEVPERQEQGRPRADHQLRLPLPQHLPAPPPLGHRHTGMPLRRFRAEPRLHPCQEFRRQRDLRQQDQRLPPRAQGIPRRPQDTPLSCRTR
jgi:hypothetical protein